MRILTLIVVLFLSACSTGIKPIEQSSVLPQQSSDTLPANWTINGRISIIRGQENWYAKFIWVQKNDDFQLSFTGPLGETELQITQVAQNSHLKTPSGERYSQNLEQLLFQETGWSLPVTSLRFWSQGVPNPGMKSQIKYNQQHQISDIVQAGWHIQYPKWLLLEQHTNNKLLLPKKIIVTKQNVKIKLIVTQWHLGESSFGFK